MRLRKFISEVYIRMGAVFCFCCLVVANSTEIVLWYQFCLLLLCSEVGLYSVLNSLILIFLAYSENLKLVVVHVFLFSNNPLSSVNCIKY